MVTAEELVAEVQAYCRAHADRAQAVKYGRYFKEGYDGWGLMGLKDHPFWNEQEDGWSGEYGDLGVSGFLRAGELLFENGKYEEGAMAIRLLKRRRHELDSGNLAGLERWFRSGIGNWAHVDVLCSEVISPLLASGQIDLEDLASWRASELKYQRRAVPVAMLGLLRAGRSVGPLLGFLESMMSDPERTVGQGLGWFLREAWKREPQPVEDLLLRWKEKAARVIFQYATEKMDRAERARFRRSPRGK